MVDSIVPGQALGEAVLGAAGLAAFAPAEAGAVRVHGCEAAAVVVAQDARINR